MFMYIMQSHEYYRPRKLNFIEKVRKPVKKLKLKYKSLIILGLLVVILYFIINYFSKILLHTEIPLAVVSSWSMVPSLQIGDMIIVSGIREGEVKEEVIIVYKSHVRAEPTVHRLIKVYEENGVISKLVTKGDANLVADYPISFSQVKGVVVFNIPYIGILKLFFEKYPFIYVTAIIILLISVILSPEEKKAKRNKSTD